MGLKVRMGLALSGLMLSSMFGVNMLSGIKDYVDTTGNIMVDIADGIGMISQGIEYLEHFLDPEAQAPPASTPPADSAATPDPTVPPPEKVVPDNVPSEPSVPPVLQTGQEQEQPAIFCQKGKCYPFDPNKAKNSNVNYETKPGLIITAPSKQPKTVRPSPKQDPGPGQQHKDRRQESRAKPPSNTRPSSRSTQV